MLGAERFAVFASLLSGARYPEAALAKAWVQLAWGAHHDAITRSESDQVYLDLLTGWRDAWELGRSARAGALAVLSGAVAADLPSVVVWNPLGHRRTDLVTVRLDEPEMIRLRELSRLDDELAQEQTRAVNRLREQFHRFFPQLLELSECADEPWLWALFESAPSPKRAARLTEAKIARLLREHRIRRIDAAQVRTILKSKPFTLAPGAAEAATEHALLLLPHLRLLHQQRADLARRIDGLLEELASAQEGQSEHRDAAILLSLPGLGRKVAATMLGEAAQAIAERDYHALRCYSGAAPITRQSGKKKSVMMRRGCNERLRNALYHWARTSIVWDAKSKNRYAQMRACGHSHGRALRGMADRWLKVLISMLRHGTLYDPQCSAA